MNIQADQRTGTSNEIRTGSYGSSGRTSGSSASDSNADLETLRADFNALKDTVTNYISKTSSDALDSAKKTTSDVADQIGDGHIGRRKLLHVAVRAREPDDRRRVAFGCNALPARAADRRVRVVVNFAPGDCGHVRVHEVYEAAKNARLGLAAKTEQDEMMLRKDGVDDLRNHGVVVAVYAGEERVALLHLAEQILTHFLPDRALRVFLFRPVAAAKLTESFRQRSHEGPTSL